MTATVEKLVTVLVALGCLVLGVPAEATASANVLPLRLHPKTFKAVGKVDKRFQSFDLEMAEVVGGRFWAPYPKAGEPALTPEMAARGSGSITAAFQKREPVDLEGNARLRMLAKALGPTYMRVSGTWANSVYFPDAEAPTPVSPPAGFDDVLTRAEWTGVVDFARAVDAKIVTSFATSKGTRDANGVWTPDQARKLVKFTRDIGGEIYAAELTNEPNAVHYPPEDFARDEAVFRQFILADAPDIKTVGPGTTGEAGFHASMPAPRDRTTDALLSAEPNATFDIFDYHFYGAVSERCAKIGKISMTSPDEALSEEWLGRTEQAYDFYAARRDRFMPGKPIWVTETAQAACGGDRWASTFLDSFRYVDQLGRLARHSVAAVFHNTLAASDYALIDDTTWQPRPNYWVALLWHRLMGQTVLEAGSVPAGLHIYAQCLPGQAGGVGLVAINLDIAKSKILVLPRGALRYTLSTSSPLGTTLNLNGTPLALTAQGALPALRGLKVEKGRASLAPESISFFALPNAGNAACQD